MKSVPTFIGKVPIKPSAPTAPVHPPGLLTLIETAQRCRCSKRHIENEIKLRRLRVVELGRLRRVDPRDLDEYLNDRKSGGSKPLGGPIQ